MSQYQRHLYAILHPNESLVASQLAPAGFGHNYAVGSARYYRGKTLFFEVDADYRDPYFEIEAFLEKTVQHADGRPKRTKFISSYRVLEHLTLASLGDLHAVSVSGVVLRLPRAEGVFAPQEEQIRLYQLLNPIRLVYASTLPPAEFCRYVTAPGYPKGAPAAFFTQYAVDIDDFRRRWERDPYVVSPVTGLHPQKLESMLAGLTAEPSTTRSIGLQSLFEANSYRRIHHGFWVGHGDQVAYYPMPGEGALKREHESWWKSIA